MVAVLRLTPRKAIVLLVSVCFASLLLFTSNAIKISWLPERNEQLENKRTVLAQNNVEIQETYESNANGAVAEWLLTLTNKPRSFEEKQVKDWYFKGGTRMPNENADFNLYLLPEQAQIGEDRIQEQLMYVPKGYDASSIPMKIIVPWQGLSVWNVKGGNAAFQECPVSSCFLENSKLRAAQADAILFKDNVATTTFPRSPNQLWILYLLECPYHTSNFARLRDVINWTATYRSDSDIVTPYERWTYFDDQVREKVQQKDYAANKTKKVAWFVSNCGAKNQRLTYAKELSKYISVDIYGACGSLSCPRSSSSRCFDLLNNDYKFYLAFENSNCKDYITEKFFVNGLQHDVVPIVMGARPIEYERASPQKSFIHTDDFESTAKLAEYLHQLDNDNESYNSYFKWKGTGEFINTHFWCRLCAMLHAPLPPKTYADVNEWWRGKGVCTKNAWRLSEEN